LIFGQTLITRISMVPLEKLCNTTLGSENHCFVQFWPIEGLVKAI